LGLDGRKASSRWRFSRKNDRVVQVIPQQAIKAIRALSTRKIVLRRQELGWHFLLRRQVFIYGGVLWSGELQGLILHEMVPTRGVALPGPPLVHYPLSVSSAIHPRGSCLLSFRVPSPPAPCFCGSEYDRHGESTNCTMPCAGNAHEICGGPGANSIYRVQNTSTMGKIAAVVVA
jgi:hypothetical protein